VTAQDVSRAASELLASGQQLLLASGPTRDALPEQSALMSALAATHGAAVEPHREEAITLPLMAELPTPGKVSAERVLSEIGVTEWTLSNGARVVVKPTEFEDDQILMRAISLGGTGYANDAEFPSARHAASIVASSGLGPLDRQTLRKVLAGRVAGAGPWIDENTEGISGDAAPKDVETLLKLVHLFVTAPRRDEPAFEAFVASLKEGLRNRDLNPAELLSDAVVEKVWNNSPRRRTPTVESVDAIDLSTVLEFYKNRFADVSDFTFVFVGKLDVGAMKPLVERYIASLPGGGRKEKPQDADLHWRKGITRVLVKAGKEDKASVSLVYHGEAPWSENAHTDLVSLQSYLGIRLREVLREQLGAVYSPQVSSTFQRIPFPQHRLSIGFQCKPTDIDKLLKATRTVMADVKKSGIAPSYVDKLKSLRTRELEEGYRSNRFWLDRLSTQYNLDLDPKDILLLYDLTQRITSDNLRLAARKYLRDDQYLDARLLPGE
jgi:zinc protease